MRCAFIRSASARERENSAAAAALSDSKLPEIVERGRRWLQRLARLLAQMEDESVLRNTSNFDHLPRTHLSHTSKPR